MANPRDQLLNDRQRRFALEYLIDRNGKQAAIRAGYSAKTAEQQGSKLLRNPKVLSIVGAAMDKQEKKLGLEGDRVIEELMRLAFVNLKDALDPVTGQPLPVHQMPEDVQRALNTIEIDALPGKDGQPVTRVGKLKMSDKLRALELLGKLRKLRLFAPQEITGADGGPLALEIAAQAKVTLAAKVAAVRDRLNAAQLPKEQAS